MRNEEVGFEYCQACVDVPIERRRRCPACGGIGAIWMGIRLAPDVEEKRPLSTPAPEIDRDTQAAVEQILRMYGSPLPLPGREADAPSPRAVRSTVTPPVAALGAIGELLVQARRTLDGRADAWTSERVKTAIDEALQQYPELGVGD